MVPNVQQKAFIYKENLPILTIWQLHFCLVTRQWYEQEGSTEEASLGSLARPFHLVWAYVYIPVCPRTLYLLGRPSPISVETEKFSWVWLLIAAHLFTKQEPPPLYVGLKGRPEKSPICSRWMTCAPPSASPWQSPKNTQVHSAPRLTQIHKLSRPLKCSGLLSTT